MRVPLGPGDFGSRSMPWAYPRARYLGVVERLAPQVLQELFEQVFPVFQTVRREDKPDGFRPTILVSDLVEWGDQYHLLRTGPTIEGENHPLLDLGRLTREASEALAQRLALRLELGDPNGAPPPMHDALAEALEVWGRQFDLLGCWQDEGLGDRWIIDQALATMDEWASQGPTELGRPDSLRWKILIERVTLAAMDELIDGTTDHLPGAPPPFVCPWYPDQEAEKDWRQRREEELAEYRQWLVESYPAREFFLPRADAKPEQPLEWLVRQRVGKTAIKDIVDEDYAALDRPDFSEATVKSAIQTARKRIGLKAKPDCIPSPREG